MSETGGRRLAYQPALDGIRGISVLAVLLFHSSFDWARGGYLGVSTFFTLSGFLICSLLLAEHRDEGTIDLRAFWGRRFRRLMPPALVGLGLALLYGATVADSTQQASLRGDVLGALGYVANWRFVLDGAGYGALFESPSPVLHFWSLAIEEQFYLVFPLLMGAVLVRGRGRARPVLAVLLALVAASLVASVVLAGDGSDVNRAYLGTDTRAAELLIGALLAVVWHRSDPARRQQLGRIGSAAGVAALVGIVACWVTVEQQTVWLYRGGLGLYALATATVILGAIAPSGLVRLLLSTRPLRLVGRYSYGVYVYHWPVFQWLAPPRLDLADGPLLLVRLAVTALLAIVSFHLLERPVRTRTLLPGRAALAAAAVAALLVASGALLSDDASDAVIDFVAAEDAFTNPTTPVGPTPPPAADGKPTIAFFGDSMALMAGLGFGDWLRATDVFADQPGSGAVQLGCGFHGATTRMYRGGELDTRDECDTTLALWGSALDTAPLDVCVVFSGIWNVDDRKLDGQWVSPGDAAYDAHLYGAMTDAADLLEQKGCVAVWILVPYSVSGAVDGRRPPDDYAENDPARYDRLNELIRRVVADHADSSALVDLPAWMDTLPGGQLDTDLRPDLVHLGWEDGTAAYVADRFLGRAVYDAYRRVVGDEVAPPLPDDAFRMDPPPPDPFAS